MLPHEAAYIAGIFDGEGTVSLNRKHREENRALIVSISNAEEAMLAYVKRVTGVGQITNKRVYKEWHTPTKKYLVANRQALDVLRQIAPYLTTYKKDRARLILKYYLDLTPRNGKYSAYLKKRREMFTQRVLRIHPNARPFARS